MAFAGFLVVFLVVVLLVCLVVVVLVCAHMLFIKSKEKPRISKILMAFIGVVDLGIVISCTEF